MMITNHSPNSSSSTYFNDSSAASTFLPQFINTPMESPTNYLNEIHDFLNFPQFEPNILGDEPYIISRASSSCAGEQTLEFEKRNNMGSCNIIATHSPLQQTAANYCLTNSSCFSPWAAPKHGGFIQTAFKPEGQVLLKNCLLKMLPLMRNHGKSSRHCVQAEVQPGFQTANYSTPPTASSGQQDETAHCHMLAERTRRKKQKECMRDLQALLPKNPKKDKVSVLQSAIEQLKELKACKEDLEKRMEELESTNEDLNSLCLSGSLSSRNLGRGHMRINTNIHGSSSINSSGGMALLSPDSAVTSLHDFHHSEHDIHHGTSSSSSGTGRASVSINRSLQSDNALSINVLISARLTLGSEQLIKVLTCLRELGLQTLSVESRIEGDIFKAEISTRANKNSIWSSEAQIEDAMVKALYTADFGN